MNCCTLVPKAAVDKVCQGRRYVTLSKCMSCEHESKVQEPLGGIIPIEMCQDDRSEKQSLLGLLRKHFGSELVTDQDPRQQPFCDACQGKHPRLSTTRLSAHHLPPVLTIQLKRFTHNPVTGVPIKLKDLVPFPQQLDIHQLLDGTRGLQVAAGVPLGAPTLT